jgi:hypothetical protein
MTKDGLHLHSHQDVLVSVRVALMRLFFEIEMSGQGPSAFAKASAVAEGYGGQDGLAGGI